VLTTLGVLGLLASLIGLIAYYWNSGSLYTLALAAFSPYLAIGALVAAVLFAISRGVTGWIGLGLCLAVLLWAGIVRAPLYGASTVPPGRDVVVMTANLRLGNADPKAVVAAVRAHHVDVLMLEELTPQEAFALRAAGLNDLLPHGLEAPQFFGAGSALLSRYAVSDAAVDPEFPFAFVSGRVAVPGISPGPIMVALHMYGPSPSTKTRQWVHDISRLPSVLAGLPSDAPVIVGGDFNATTDVSRFRNLLRGGYADGAEQAGAGFTPTYPANALVPLIAIDHVLTRGAVARRVDSLRIPGSDHRALVAIVRIPLP
jgi:endonuclease/exonuclease/phosphatase (EEP) superfamily protein YafD